jgi:hypothetical protein
MLVRNREKRRKERLVKTKTTHREKITKLGKSE